MKRPFCVGLTGGIGSGKSLVASLFAASGVEVVDTDVLARELTCAGGAAMVSVAKAFGDEVISADGSLDRPRMREIVFADASARRRLEAILHPLIRQSAAQRLMHSQAPYVMLVVPLLVETGAYDGLVDRVLVVDCPPDQQVERVMRRDGASRAMAEAMLAAQAGRMERLAAADDVIDNGGAPEAVARRVTELHRAYLAASGSRK